MNGRQSKMMSTKDSTTGMAAVGSPVLEMSAGLLMKM